MTNQRRGRKWPNQLRELEAEGLVTRTVHEAVPPKVEYSVSQLSARGW